MDALHIIDIFATATFGVTGVLVANKAKINLFASLVFAIVTGVGGGTLRDLLLGVTPFWLTDVIYIYVLIAVTIVTIFWIKYFKIPEAALVIADTFALGFATMVGTEKALGLGFHPLISIIMGVMTGVIGGVIRDTLSDRTPAAFENQNLYALASFSSAFFTVLIPTEVVEGGAVGGGIASALAIRFGLLRTLPLFTRILPFLARTLPFLARIIPITTTAVIRFLENLIVRRHY